MKKEISPWQIMFYLSLSVLTIWLILKVTGVIQTPLWLEYGVPVASLIFGILSLYQNLLENINKVAVGLATLTAKFEHLNSKVDHIDDDVEILKDSI